MLNFGASKPRVRGGARGPPPGSAPGKHGPFHPKISYLSSFTRRKQYKILHCSNVNTFDNMADIVEILCEQIVPAIFLMFTLLTKRLQNSPLKAPLRELYSCTNSQNKRFCYFF